MRPSMRNWSLSRVVAISVALVLFAANCGGNEDDMPNKGRAAPDVKRARQALASQSHAPAGCDSSRATICFVDTAYAHTYPGETTLITGKKWIWFGTSGDSLEIHVAPSGYVQTNLGEERDTNHNNVGYFHRRLTGDGVVQVWITMDETLGDTVTYALQVHREQSPGRSALDATGARSQLTILSHNSRERFSVVPLSIAATVRDLFMWAVDAGAYNVALVADSLYQVCRLPCVSPDTVRLPVSGSATVRDRGY